MTKNCGHEDFGDEKAVRLIDSGNIYWCTTCKKYLTDNCGHESFGKQ